MSGASLANLAKQMKSFNLKEDPSTHSESLLLSQEPLFGISVERMVVPGLTMMVSPSNYLSPHTIFPQHNVSSPETEAGPPRGQTARQNQSEQ